MAKPLRFSNDGAELSFELAARSKKVPSTICKLGTQVGDSHFPAKLGPSPGAAQAGDSHFPAKLQAGCGVLQAGPSWGPKLGTATFQPSWSCKLGTATFRLQAGETASWGQPLSSQAGDQAGDSHFPAKLGPSPGAAQAAASWGQPLSVASWGWQSCKLVQAGDCRDARRRRSDLPIAQDSPAHAG